MNLSLDCFHIRLVSVEQKLANVLNISKSNVKDASDALVELATVQKRMKVSHEMFSSLLSLLFFAIN